jgi:dTDP-4-dehydrorhamnose 3,5-epimerase-like enzyme
MEQSAPTLVDDLAKHIVEHLLIAKPEPGIYHIVNEGGATWFEWAQEIGRVMELPVEFAKRDPSTIQRPAQRPMNSTLRNTKLPPMRSWKEALRDMIAMSGLKFSPSWKDIGIQGVAIECMPRIGNEDGAVLHMLPGGILNAHGFGTDLKDVYAFTAKGKNQFRGGHFHPKLNELFFQFAGKALWVLSDFRESSPTFGKTVGVEIDVEQWIQDGAFPRIRVPSGVYHAIFPLTDERVMSVGIGSTAYDKEDYRYPKPQEVPGMMEVMAKYGIEIPEEKV